MPPLHQHFRRDHSETYAGKYKGIGFSGKIKIADFVDLETGEFILDSGAE